MRAFGSPTFNFDEEEKERTGELKSCMTEVIS